MENESFWKENLRFTKNPPLSHPPPPSCLSFTAFHKLHTMPTAKAKETLINPGKTAFESKKLWKAVIHFEGNCLGISVRRL